MRKAPVASLLAFALVVAIAPSMAVSTVETFYSTSSDGHIYNEAASYTEVHDNSTGYTVVGSADRIYIGQVLITNYNIKRGFVSFDTSSIPDDAVITSATLSLYGRTDSSGTDFDIVIQNGQPSYPSDPLVLGDYYYAHYGTTDGGSLNTFGFTTTGYNDITLNENALTWINKTGTTKLALRSNNDINSIAPTGYEYVGIYSSEKGSGYKPKLTINYYHSGRSWQEVERWGDNLQMPHWQTVETWGDVCEVVLTVGVPVLISPENDNTIYDNTPSFRWIVGANANNHRFLLDNEDTFSNPIENVLLGTSTATYTVTAPLANDNYWWKVIAISGVGENSSSAWTFELQTPPGKQWQTVERWDDSMLVLFPYSGSGTVDDPYIIENIWGLQAMNDNLSAHYALGNNIDASDTVNWNDEKGFLPIGTWGNHFTGSFDGQGHQITNLYINRGGMDYVGFFGYAGNKGVVENVGMENENVTGNCGVGGLVGLNGGTVSNSYSTGSVSGVFYVGGLVGANEGTVSNSYSTGSVSGVFYVGGLVGVNGGTVSNSYSTGSVSGDFCVGGLVGLNGGTVSNSFWDNQTSGQATSDGGTGKTTENMKTVRTFTDIAWSDGLTFPWDFENNPYDDVATADIWDIDGVTNDGYPFLGPPLLGWRDVETWGDSLEIEEEEPPPPPPPDYIPWVMFVIRFLSVFGPFGFVAWKFTQIRDPTTGARAAVWVGVGFVAFVLLWFVVDAVEAILYSI